MLPYDRTDVSKGIEINNTSASKESMLCQYWYYKDVAYKFKPRVCNKYYDVLMTAYELKNIAILNVKAADIDAFYGVLIKMKLLRF